MGYSCRADTRGGSGDPRTIRPAVRRYKRRERPEVSVIILTIVPGESVGVTSVDTMSAGLTQRLLRRGPYGACRTERTARVVQHSPARSFLTLRCSEALWKGQACPFTGCTTTRCVASLLGVLAAMPSCGTCRLGAKTLQNGIGVVGRRVCTPTGEAMRGALQDTLKRAVTKRRTQALTRSVGVANGAQATRLTTLSETFVLIVSGESWDLSPALVETCLTSCRKPTSKNYGFVARTGS